MCTSISMLYSFSFQPSFPVCFNPVVFFFFFFYWPIFHLLFPEVGRDLKVFHQLVTRRSDLRYSQVQTPLKGVPNRERAGCSPAPGYPQRNSTDVLQESSGLALKCLSRSYFQTARRQIPTHSVHASRKWHEIEVEHEYSNFFFIFKQMQL